MPQKALRKPLTQAFPYLTALVGIYFISVAVVPFIYPAYPLDPLVNTGLYNFNVLLSRILFGVMGLVLIVSYERIAKRTLEGWYNVFYVSLFQAFFVLVVFNLVSASSLLIAWYIMFAVKPDFKK